MSTFGTVSFLCSDCGKEVSGEVGLVVNLGKRLDQRQAILDRRFNTLFCECGASATIVRTVGLVDFGRCEWILCYPVWAEVYWKDLAMATEAQFLRVVGAAPKADQGRPFTEWRVRLCFGYEMVREKLVTWDAGLEDADVEMEKLALLQDHPERFGARIALLSPARLWGLSFSDGTILEVSTPPLPAPSLFDPAELRIDPFVSYRRWLISPKRADPLSFDLDGRLNPRSTRDRLPT